MLASFLIFFTLFTAVGIVSAFWRRETVEDYMLASREVPSWLVGLSFGATISSGATFIGFAGLSYHSGITAIYTVIALMIGDYLSWHIAGSKIRRKAQEKKAHTYPSLIGRLGDTEFPKVTLVASLLTIICMGTYCAAQLVAGAKVGQAIFGWDFGYFVLAGGLILLAYCWAGGIRASIWTDALQALIILFSLMVLIYAGLGEIGGINTMWQKLSAIDPKLTDPFQFKLLPVSVAWLFFGIAILGQPQLMVRHMVARSDRDIMRAKWIYMLWRIIVLALAVMSGLVARILIPESEVFDPELSITQLWQDLLPPALVGLLIAGLFSATMSTADSLLLSASSAMTQNLIPRWRGSYIFAKIGTVIVVVLTMAIAMVATKGVLALVIVSWNIMAGAAVPLIVVQLLGGRPSQKLALAMILSGLTVTVTWRYGFGLHKQLMELVPGMLTGFAVYAIASAIPKIRKLAKA